MSLELNALSSGSGMPPAKFAAGSTPRSSSTTSCRAHLPQVSLGRISGGSDWLNPVRLLRLETGRQFDLATIPRFEALDSLRLAAQ